jgi:hypothetical protein
MLSEWAQIAIALFTAVTALAALLSVRRVEQDRRARLIPELHIEILCDIPNNEMRLTVVNLGAPAREVRVMGTVGDFGFFHPTPPTTYWQEGESRTYRISMPVRPGVEAQAFVEARDLGKKYLVVATVGGATYRWNLSEAEKLSPAEEWRKLFPNDQMPPDVKYPQMAIELVERHR